MAQQSEQPTQQNIPVDTPFPDDPDPESSRVTIPLKIEDWLSVLIMAVLALITFANVIVRYMTHSSFAWTEEISVFLLIVLTMTASSSAFVRRQHIRIEFIADGGAPARKRARVHEEQVRPLL